jgi:FixJ family two-component response regulator
MALGGAVIVLDDDDDLLVTLCELVQLLTGRTCVAAHSLAELEARQGDALACTDAILDINLGPAQPSGLDVYAWLKKHRFAGHISFLTGHARSHPLVARAARLDGVAVYQKPIAVEELRRILVERPAGEPPPAVHV